MTYCYIGLPKFNTAQMCLRPMRKSCAPCCGKRTAARSSITKTAIPMPFPPFPWACTGRSLRRILTTWKTGFRRKNWPLKNSVLFAGQHWDLAVRTITCRNARFLPVLSCTNGELLLQNEMHRGPGTGFFKQNATITIFAVKLLKKSAECYKIDNECGSIFRMVL